MALEEHIRDIQRKLKNNGYENEQSISQGVVLRLLKELGWPTYDTQLVIPEFSVRNGRVDFALCVKSKKPVIFIEVKQPGKTLGADEQLFNYAYKQGVPLAIITDGREWHFYLPAGAGSYEERRVYMLDLIERELEESAYRLTRYLSYQQAEKVPPFEDAKEDHNAIYKERETKENIPRAWGKLLEEKNEAVITAISEKVESLCGYPPTAKQVITFLNTLTPEIPEATVRRDNRNTTLTPMQTGITTTPAQAHTRVTPVQADVTGKAARTRIQVTFPDGVVISHPTASATMMETFRKIGFDRVASLNIEIYRRPLVSKQQLTYSNSRWSPSGSGFFVCMNSLTTTKVQQLKDISAQLGLGLKIETF